MARRKHVQLIYLGGTLGMVASDHGYVPASNLGALLAERIPELGDPSMPSFELLEYDPPLDSSNATPRHWYELAQNIFAQAEKFDGFVVIHGTDTLAYTASALSFLLRGLGLPVIVTGSQIPLSRLRNDAQSNLVNALHVIALGRCTEVAVCFGRHLFRGNRVRKVKATALDAFASPNFLPLAEIGTDIHFRDPPAPPEVEGAAPPAFRPGRISILPLHPGIHASLLAAAADCALDGLILECYGVGNAPDRDLAFLDALRQASTKGTVVVAVSQCHQGAVSLGLYAAGYELAACGVVGGFDMTPEAAFTKLHWLWAQGHGAEEIRALMGQNLCGELTAERPHSR